MRPLFRSAAGFAVAVTATAALAQDAARPPITVRGEAEVQTRRPQQREVQKVPDQAAAPQSQQDDGRTTRASALMGTDLVLENGDTLGRINDLVIDNMNGQVAYVIVETDQDYRPVPWKTLVMHNGEQADDNYFVIGMEREKFMQGPAIQRTEWQSYTAPQWQTQWQTFQPRVTKFYANVNTRVPADFRRNAVVRDVNRDLNQADRKVDQGSRKVDREIDKADRKIDRKID